MTADTFTQYMHDAWQLAQPIPPIRLICPHTPALTCIIRNAEPLLHHGAHPTFSAFASRVAPRIAIRMQGEVIIPVIKCIAAGSPPTDPHIVLLPSSLHLASQPHCCNTQPFFPLPEARLAHALHLYCLTLPVTALYPYSRPQCPTPPQCP